MQLRENDFDTGQACSRLDVNGYTAPVVDDLNRAVGVECDPDGCPVPGESFVNRVVNYLPQAVHQAAFVRGADVHSGALPHRLKAFKDTEVSSGVIVGH